LSLNPKIPTCNQLLPETENYRNQKQLTIEQTNESRRVTKCRFIIEKKIGEVKKFLALNKRRNSEVGHLQIDYRIACAMVNFTHKPCCADASNAEKIAKRILKKMIAPKTNILAKLIKLRLGTKITSAYDLNSISDFPKLKKSHLIKKFFLGSYYMKMCKSYLFDFLKTNAIYLITEKSITKSLSIDNLDRNLLFDGRSNIIAVELTSRHHRGTLKKTKQMNYVKQFRARYTVFIQYVPNQHNVEAITCKFI
jgi:hypothetical protein